MFGRPFVAVLGGDSAGEHRTAGAVGVGDGIFREKLLSVRLRHWRRHSAFPRLYAVDAVLLVL